MKSDDDPVAYLEITICIQEEVGRLQITVQDIGGMKGFQTSNCLDAGHIFSAVLENNAPDRESTGSGRRKDLESL